ncbi:DUF2079 domain-containing protein [Candidatus Uhrbacteria bacterium]|nr:DUF2079 domain-containing protein [Candidatus Uhrbacteria bacterium]
MRQHLRATAWLATLVLAFTIAVSAVGFWKYSHYRYGGMDLAIYTNVLSGLSHGGGWWSSIQGGSYLGDHVEPILLFLIPFFRLWPDPRLLLILQALALGLTAIPIYFLLSLFSGQRRENDERGEISNNEDERAGDAEGGSPTARNRMSTVGVRSGRTRERWPFVVAALSLLNPLLWNAALFEFHALAFAPLFLLSAAYAYVRRRFWFCFLWLLLSLSVREDVALIVIAFGAIAVIERLQQRWRSAALVGRDGLSARRKVREAGMDRAEGEGATERLEPEPARWDGEGVRAREAARPQPARSAVWILAPLLLGLLWFTIAIRIAGTYSASGGYKFSVYYGWLAHAGPIDALQHLVSIGNIDMALGLLLPFLFLPILRPRWLLLALPPLLQILLSEPGGSNIVVELHYALLFLPALTLASIDAIKQFSPPPAGWGSERGRGQSRALQWLARRFPLPRPFAISLGIAVYLAAAWMLGPFPGIASVIMHGASSEDRARRAAYNELLAHVPLDAPVAVGYAALPHVAARRSAYALPYAYLGVTQYGLAPYELPDTTRYLLLDQRDAIAYAVQFPGVRWSAPHAAGGPERLRTLIERGPFGIVVERNGVALLTRHVFPESRGTARDPDTKSSGRVEGPTGGLDPRYLAPTQPVRGRLVIDGLRDIVVQ